MPVYMNTSWKICSLQESPINNHEILCHFDSFGERQLFDHSTLTPILLLNKYLSLFTCLIVVILKEVLVTNANS